MKKLFLCIAIATFFTVSCKKNKDDDSATSNTVTHKESDIPPGCVYFTPLEGMAPADQIQWLKSRQGTICSNYLTCVLESHQLTSQENTDLQNQIGANPHYTSIKLGDILQNKLCNYNEYRTFTADPSGNISMGSTTSFSITSTCYSLPLFHAISKIPNVTRDTDLKFIKAQINGYTTIVFLIDGISSSYFDYSRWPTFTAEKNPL